jgi:hypothetical protein
MTDPVDEWLGRLIALLILGIGVTAALGLWLAKVTGAL